MTCKDCIHYKVCYPRIALHMGEDIMGKPDKKMQDCKHFIQIERGRKMSKVAGKFQEIIINMRGNKPYYEIKYISSEDGEMHIGYSSYKIECISEFLREYFIPTVEERKHGH